MPKCACCKEEIKKQECILVEVEGKELHFCDADCLGGYLVDRAEYDWVEIDE